VLPLIVHLMAQPELEKDDGPIGIICAPTRELAIQVHCFLLLLKDKSSLLLILK